MLKVITKFNCVVQMVVTTPCQAKNLLSRVEKYRMQLMVMDSTTRIHVFVTAKDEVKTNFNLFFILEFLAPIHFMHL